MTCEHRGSEVLMQCDVCGATICEACSGGFELIDGVEMYYCKTCAERNEHEWQT